MFGRRKIATLVAEFLGTGILTLLILSVQRSTIGVPFFVALGAGLAFTTMIFAFGSTSGAFFNPAITIGMWTARKISTINAVLYVGLQLLGGWAAYGFYTYLVNSTLQPIGGHFTGRILAAEAVGAGIFAFAWAASVYQNYSRAVSAALGGLAYMIGIVAASSAAIGLLNPAVALGVRAWVWGTYVAGPILGAVVGINLYGLLFTQPTEVLVETEVVTLSATAAPAKTRAVAARKTAATRKAPAAKRRTATRATTTRRRSTRTTR